MGKEFGMVQTYEYKALCRRMFFLITVQHSPDAVSNGCNKTETASA
jgi:hypothetical protein